MNFEEKLRVQFRKALKRGTCDNAMLDPAPSDVLAPVFVEGEVAVVRVDCRDGGHYWFTSVRVLKELGGKTHDLLRYSEVRDAGWMFRTREKMSRSMMDPHWSSIKRDNFDRVEVQLRDGTDVVLEGLGQAYVPILNFVQWLRPAKSRTAPHPFLPERSRGSKEGCN